MDNIVFDYFCIDDEDEDGKSINSHAVYDDDDSTLCGISRSSFDGWIISSLADRDCHVACDKCASELRELNISYAGPLPFIVGSKQINGILLEDFGCVIPDRSYEHFFAHGRHEPGAVLELARMLSRNELSEWEEHYITIYAHWIPFSSINADPDFCYRIWHTSDIPGDDKTLKITPLDVTVIRHKAWPLLSKPDGKIEYECLHLKSWLAGSKKLGRKITPADVDVSIAPGFAVYGKPIGSEKSRCLEWPTPDFDLALRQIEKWSQAGAKELSILNHGMAVPMEMLTPETVSMIQCGLRSYGRDCYISDIIEHGVD